MPAAWNAEAISRSPLLPSSRTMATGIFFRDASISGAVGEGANGSVYAGALRSPQRVHAPVPRNAGLPVSVRDGNSFPPTWSRRFATSSLRTLRPLTAIRTDGSAVGIANGNAVHVCRIEGLENVGYFPGVYFENQAHLLGEQRRDRV